MTSRFMACLAFVALAGAALGQGVSSTVVDPNDRSDVLRHFHEVYLASESYQEHHGWTGSVAACDAGTVSAALHEDTLRRINYYRALAGLPAEITFTDALNAKCQEAALMMAYNNTLSHYPPTSWSCYTADGAEAAGHSNLSWGQNNPHYGPSAIDGHIRDDDSSNISVGHRRWLLYTKAPDEMGHGSIPLTPIIGNPSNDNATCAVWVIGPAGSAPDPELEFVAWPPAACVPYPVAFGRWSFGLPIANGYSPDFSSATVSMSHDGAPVSLSVVHRSSGAGLGDPTIAWDPVGFPMSTAPDGDQSYAVTVSGISGAPQSSYSYEVVVIDPYALEPIALDGSDTAYVGYSNSYDFEGVSAAEAYELRVAEIAEGNWLEGAESSPAPQVIDSTDPAHPLLISAFDYQGSRSFHVVEDGDAFEVDRSILAGTTSELEFFHAFRWVGDGTSLIAEVQADGGSWQEVWRRTGTLTGSASSSDRDNSWTQVNVPLDSYDGQTLRLRFRYIFEFGYLWFPYPDETATDFGAVIDNIRVTNSQELGAESIVSATATAGSITFAPAASGEYLLQLRAQVAGQWFGYGPAKSVNAVLGTPPVPTSLTITGTGIDATSQFWIEVQTTGAGFSSLALEEHGNSGGWTANTGFSLTDLGSGVYKLSLPMPGDRQKMYRVIGTP